MGAPARAVRVDLADLEQQILAEVTGLAEDLRRRRIRIGGLLARARPAWPQRGTAAKGWGEFLARVGIDDSTARRYMDEYRDPEAFARAERKANVNGGSGETDRGSYALRRAESVPPMRSRVTIGLPADDLGTPLVVPAERRLRSVDDDTVVVDDPDAGALGPATSADLLELDAVPDPIDSDAPGVPYAGR